MSVLNRSELPPARAYYEQYFPGKIRTKSTVLVKCPFHKEKTASFSIYDLDRGAFKCHGCGKGGGDIIDFHMLAHPGLTFSAAVSQLTGHQFQAPQIASTIKQAEKPARDRTPELLSTWAETVSISNDDPVDLYLKNRNLKLSIFPESVRLHPALEYWEEDEDDNWFVRGIYPAMVAKVCDLFGDLVGLHRTYLTAEGEKADVPKAKKLISSQRSSTIGGAIRLCEATDRLAVAEGIETALSFHCLTGVPAWSVISAGGLEKVMLPDGIRNVFICVDIDKTKRGEQAAKILTERLMLEGKQVSIATPPGRIPEGAKSFDWCDFLGQQHE